MPKMSINNTSRIQNIVGQMQLLKQIKVKLEKLKINNANFK